MKTDILNLLFEESLDSIFVMDIEYRFTEMNPSFQNKFKDYNSLENLFKEKDDFLMLTKKLKSEGRIDEEEYRLINAQGRETVCLITIIKIKSKPGYLGLIRDITSRIQAEKKLLRVEKMLMTSKLSRTIAHEVRNPLTNLGLALEQLKEEIEGEVEDAELYTDIIRRNSERINTLITDLLNSSRPKELNLKKLSLNQIVNEAIELVKDRLTLQKVKLEKILADDLPMLDFDDEQLRVAILNLLVNAIEAMKSDHGILRVLTEFDDEEVSLKIIDNGKGIPKENMDHLFDPFYTGKRNGTGLGLTAVQNIVNAHDGNIEVESEPNKGTTFILSFPVSKV